MKTVRYAQCWEDADVLMAALDVQRGHSCLAIASAGDNALALLSRSPKGVVAIDYSDSQIACLELRVAAYQVLDDDELVRFLGARSGDDRLMLYGRCRDRLSPFARSFWDARPCAIATGIFSFGKFERYLALFRMQVLPLIESNAAIESLLTPKSREERAEFFARVWDNWRWRVLFKLFFSRAVMSAIGRERAFFAYAQADVSEHLRRRVRHAMVELDPSQNPYLHWMLKGTYGDILPFSLRPENISAIRRNLDRLTWRTTSLDAYLHRSGEAFDRFALSDVFEYMSLEQYENSLEAIANHALPHARLVYWNMIVPRARTMALANRIAPESERAKMLHAVDKAFFYSNLVIEQAA